MCSTVYLNGSHVSVGSSKIFFPSLKVLKLRVFLEGGGEENKDHNFDFENLNHYLDTCDENGIPGKWYADIV